MKTFTILMLIFSSQLFAGTIFKARLANDNKNLVVQLQDDHLLPPFEAGGLWNIFKGTDQIKTIKEKELILSCQGLKNQNDETFGNCKLIFPYELFRKAGNMMVMKLTGVAAARLNHYFVDSSYLSMQRNQAYLSSYNTRKQFNFGITEDLITK